MPSLALAQARASVWPAMPRGPDHANAIAIIMPSLPLAEKRHDFSYGKIASRYRGTYQTDSTTSSRLSGGKEAGFVSVVTPPRLAKLRGAGPPMSGRPRFKFFNPSSLDYMSDLIPMSLPSKSSEVYAMMVRKA
jgi:hypothetical protein